MIFYFVTLCPFGPQCPSSKINDATGSCSRNFELTKNGATTRDRCIGFFACQGTNVGTHAAGAKENFQQRKKMKCQWYVCMHVCVEKLLIENELVTW